SLPDSFLARGTSTIRARRTASRPRTRIRSTPTCSTLSDPEAEVSPFSTEVAKQENVMTTSTINTVKPTGAGTILFIHGLWLTPRSWEHWAERYESRGYKVLAPSWPGMEAEVEELNRDPAPITRLDISQITDYYDRIVRDLPIPPVIIGHSTGGTIMQ